MGGTLVPADLRVKAAVQSSFSYRRPGMHIGGQRCKSLQKSRMCGCPSTLASTCLPLALSALEHRAKDSDFPRVILTASKASSKTVQSEACATRQAQPQLIPLLRRLLKEERSRGARLCLARRRMAHDVMGCSATLTLQLQYVGENVATTVQ